MKTIVISLYGGPGCGKSTMAAQLFVEFKKAGKSCELVTEWVKGWAWENRKPNGIADALYILAKQAKQETKLYGKVDFVVTDSPLGLCPVYESLYNPGSNAIEAAYTQIAKERKATGVEDLNLFVSRSHAYVTAGRFETEELAKKVDEMCYRHHSGFHVDSFDRAASLLKTLGYL